MPTSKALSENKLYVFLVFLPDGCVSVALSTVEYAAAPLPCPPAKIRRNLVEFVFGQSLKNSFETAGTKMNLP